MRTPGRGGAHPVPWRLLHRWLGLGICAVLLCSALSGVVLALAGPERLAARASACPGPLPADGLQALADAVRQRMGAAASLTLRLPADGQGCVIAYVRSAGWNGALDLSAGDARIVSAQREGEGWYSLLFELHSNLLLGDAGKAVLASAGGLYLLLWLSGLRLWWPRQWRLALRIHLGRSLRLALLDGHRLAGAVLGVLALAAVLSGSYVAWRPIAGWVNALAGDTAIAGPSAAAARSQPPPPLDDMVRHAAWPQPHARLVDLSLPAGGGKPIRLRHHLPGDPHPNGQSYTWLDPNDGAVLRRLRWDQADAGARLQGWLYPYHAGRLWGAAHTLLVLLAGASLAWLAASGPVGWALRRRALAPNATPAVAAGAASPGAQR